MRIFEITNIILYYKSDAFNKRMSAKWIKPIEVEVYSLESDAEEELIHKLGSMIEASLYMEIGDRTLDHIKFEYMEIVPSKAGTGIYTP